MPIDFSTVPERRNSNSIKWTFYPEDVLPLWVADMDFPAPEPIRKALHAAVEHGIYGYELPSKTLLASVAARMKKLYNWEVTVESIVPVTGLVSGFVAAAGAFCQPGEGYLIQPPVYMPFNDIQRFLGVIRQEAELVKTAQDGILRYTIDWETFEAAFNSGGSQTRMFLLCNPHNPSGQVYTPAELSRMAELCLKHDAIIVSDEIHSELLLGDSRHTPIASLAPEIADRSITLVAPSKTFNTAGLFCGFAIIPNREIRERYKHQIERMTLHIASLAQVAALAAFSGECDDWLVELRAYLGANRDFLVDFVRREMPETGITRPDATYLAWIDCNAYVQNGKIDDSPYHFFLKKAKVALNDGAAFGAGGKNFVRINFGCPRATLEAALTRMKQALV